MDNMNINGSYANGYNNYTNKTSKSEQTQTKSSKTTATVTDKTAKSTDAAAVYEPSKESVKVTSKNTTKTGNAALIAQLKADQQNKTAQMQSLVTKMFKQQGVTIGSTDEMWKALAGGNFTADADTIAQAKQDISEDGYWGVSQTSDRIFSFAMALSGGDEEKMQSMKSAVEKGFKEATKSWGKSLPDISSQTYDSVMKKFDDYFNTDQAE